MLTRPLALALFAAGCFGSVRVYRGLQEGRAMQTCNANKRFQTSAPGRNERHAMDNAVRSAKNSVRGNGGCGLLVTREGYDRTNRVAYLSRRRGTRARLHGSRRSKEHRGSHPTTRPALDVSNGRCS